MSDERIAASEAYCHARRRTRALLARFQLPTSIERHVTAAMTGVIARQGEPIDSATEIGVLRAVLTAIDPELLRGLGLTAPKKARAWGAQ